MDDETLRKKISLIRWVAIIALIASFVSYLFPYFSAAAFGVGVQISGINMISLAFGALPGTSFGDTLSILLYIAPLVFGVVAGIALWAYYYRACAVFSFLAGGSVLLSMLFSPSTLHQPPILSNSIFYPCSLALAGGLGCSEFSSVLGQRSGFHGSGNQG